MHARRVVVGVCGSIAAYKAADVVRRLTKDGASVRVVMTPTATKFVGPATFAALSGQPVHLDVFEDPDRVVHVELGRWAEAFLVCAATASTLERLASGTAADMLSATYLMARCPVVIAPAMHTEMWEHPAVTRNVERLVADGAQLVAPVEGPLASGDFGVGRLAEPADIVEALRRVLSERDLDGVRVLVTSGPTLEPLDPVRFLSNHSSGRMGFAVAAAAARRGAEVTVVAGPTTAEPPSGVRIVRITTAQDLLEECLGRFEDCDVAVMAAAVADWRPAGRSDSKMKKRPGQDAPVVALEPNPDVAAELGRKKSHQVVVAFAAETEDVIANGSKKLESKHADLVVANRVGAPGTGFQSETNDAALITQGGVDRLPRLTKDELAGRILDRVAGILRDRRPPPPSGSAGPAAPPASG